MKAIAFEKFGNVDVLSSITRPVPKITDHEILVRVMACGLNPVDYKIRSGLFKELFPVNFPHILGGDISGIVVERGERANDFEIGSEVFFSNDLTRNGGYAEYCAVDSSIVALRPKTLDHLQSAALPVAGLTSIKALRDFGNIQPGQNVLIHAGAGGVGSFAIQYAKLMGAKVFATGSLQNHSYLKGLGADVVIDYHDFDFVQVCLDAGGMDIVLESIGGSNYKKSLLATRENGRVPSIVNAPDAETQEVARRKNIQTDFVLLENRKDYLDEIRELIDTNKIQPIWHSLVRNSEIKQAHSLLESGRTRGKLVIEPGN